MEAMKIHEQLSYDDVLLLPSYSDFLPHEADVATEIIPGIKLKVPIVSAAMDTVTEDRLAIALALQGGAGVIHRNLTPRDQAQQVANVKRYLNYVIDNPLTVAPDQTIEDVWNVMQENSISGLPVVENEKLVGIITSRDMRFCKDYKLRVKDVMTPDPVVEVGTPKIESARDKFNTHKIEKLPVVDEQGRLTGLITVKDMEKHDKYPHAATDEAGRLLVGAAISPVDLQRRLPLLQQARVDFVVLDTAHGESKNVVDAIKTIKAEYEVPVIGGNVATAEGAERLIKAGADAIKVGVGPGSICTTRIVAGIGVPQFSAVIDACLAARKHNVPVIADGGIKYSGDIVKAIGAGAAAVMVGNLFAGMKESPGREIIYEGRIFKAYRGMGSIASIRKGSGDRYQMNEGDEPVPEGVEGRVPYKGELAPYVHQLVTGLKKGMGYTGCRNLTELRNYGKFVRITAAGMRESHAHDVVITQEPPNYSR
ncbi:IMP dehydrogenase [Spirochaeta africana]|uniref:Inosine-5'-monophosphate dehydrogenase n=1 Tax=Spirochaeta africana (strain ATCC 700263 / DSM 8902 / Z-7692) TaxID=889378 RepID=H9UJH5_SPIAZ|nr:IMP dehydrogenase [Spirochaeta africana]AFG37668.1 inosine-5''-monophosphate dehydrogenase [Spirochaeta africana DSM 8902]